MSNGENGKSGPQFSTGALITSAALIGGGALIVLAGLAVGGGHLAWVTRQWVRDWEVPPSELARIKLNQAKVAVSAGTAAWQNGPVSNPASVS